MPYDYKAKKKNINQLNQYMLAKTVSMFEYSGLPETIPPRELELMLQKSGYAFITKADDGKLYAFTGGLGGNLDAYGNPTQIVISNPYLKFNKTCDLFKDGILIRNDDLELGLLPYYEKQNTLLVENDINMVVWGFNSRTVKTISAPDDKTKESAQSYLNKIVEGEISVIGENAFFDGVKVQSSNSSSGGADIQSMVEYHQYLQAKMYNEVGLAANFNMKRERLISSELDQAEDSLFPFVYNMMSNRISGIKAVNEMFGLEIVVDFGSVWALKNKELVDGDPTDNKPEVTDPENADNGNGEPAQAPETSPETDVNNNSENSEDDNNGQKSEESTNQNSDVDSGNDSESEKQVAELQAVLDDESASDEDKKAAQDLLDEINGGNNV